MGSVQPERGTSSSASCTRLVGHSSCEDVSDAAKASPLHGSEVKCRFLLGRGFNCRPPCHEGARQVAGRDAAPHRIVEDIRKVWTRLRTLHTSWYSTKLLLLGARVSSCVFCHDENHSTVTTPTSLTRCVQRSAGSSRI